MLNVEVVHSLCRFSSGRSFRVCNRYSREQIETEDAAMQRTSDPADDRDYEWGIVAVKGQDVDYERAFSCG